MAGKVAEIKQLLNPDGLARDISTMYDQWKRQRVGKEAEWKELRNYLFATDTSKTSNSALPWKNSTTTPKLTQIRDNLHANYMSAMFSSSDWLKWEGDSDDDDTVAKRRGIEAYMKNKLDKSGFKTTIAKLLYDYIDYGNALGEVVFINEQTTDEETGEIIQGYVGPKLVRTSVYDHVFNPVSIDYASSPKITRYVKSIGELKEESQSRPELEYNIEVVQKMEEVRKALSEFKDSDLTKSEAYLADGFGSLREYYGSGYVEILEFEGDIYCKESGTFQKNQLITIIDRLWVVRHKTNPSWLGKAGRAHVAWRERPDNLYGMGPLDNLVGLQYRIDHLENLKADALDLTIHPPKVLRGNVDSFQWGPDAEIHIPDGDGSVDLLSPNPAAFQVNNEIAYLMAMMEEMAGAPKEAMGIRSPGEKTAFEVQQLHTAASRIFQEKISKFEDEFLEPILNIMLEVARRNMNGTDLVRVLDDDLGIEGFLSVTKEDITASGKIRPVGSKHHAARAQLMQNMQGVFNSAVGQMIAPHVSVKRLSTLVEEMLGWERYNIIRPNIAIFEQAETQRLMNSAQEQVEVESMTPGSQEGMVEEML
jgi:hypothetical protein